MSDVSELPLKKPQETFVDEPQEISDVNVHDLVIDINDDSKNINDLHLCEAICVLVYTLEDLMKLQEHRELFESLRSEYSKKNGVNLDEKQQEREKEQTEQREQREQTEQRGIDEREGNGLSTVRSSTPPSPPPSKILKREEPIIRETTPDSLDQKRHFDDNSFDNSFDSSEDDSSHDTQKPDPPVVISIEELIEKTDLNRSYTIDFQRMQPEIKYYQDPKIRLQNDHVVKVFDLVTPPTLTIETFLTRIRTYSSAISVSCYIHAAFLIFKLCFIHDVLKLTPCNVYRLILASLRCSTKKLEDIYQKQKTFATVGGVNTKDLFKIEVGFLFLCNFRLIVNEDTLNTHLKTFAQLRGFVKKYIDDVE